MSEVLERYRRVADGFSDRLHGVGDDQWRLPTPCSEWDVRQLVAHVVVTHERIVGAVTGAEVVHDDPTSSLKERWESVRADVATGLDDPAFATRVVGRGFGDQQFEQLVGRVLCADTLFHTWDLARATGQDEGLDADAVTCATQFLQEFDEAIRGPGGFAPKVHPPRDADDQTRLLSFGGRTVR